MICPICGDETVGSEHCDDCRRFYKLSVVLLLFVVFAVLPGCGSPVTTVAPLAACSCGDDSVFLQSCLTQPPPLVLQRGYASPAQAPGGIISGNSIGWSEKYVTFDVSSSWVGTVANTGSMRPTLNDGNHVVFVKPACGDVRAGDIIAYSATGPGNWSGGLHRVLEVLPGGGFVLKGDNNDVVDPAPVNCSQVIGRVVAIIY